MTARPYRREQRRHVVIEVLPDRRGAGPGPLAEGHALRHVPGALGRPDAHHRGVEHVPGPGGPGIAAQGRRVGAPGVHRGPQRLPRGAPARAPSPGHGGVGERGHQDRAELVREPPAPPVPQRTRLLVTGVHAHLHGRRRAHHGAALGPRTVEIALHGVVPGLMEVAGRRVPGVLAVTAEAEARLAQLRADGGQVGRHGPYALHQGGGGSGTQLQLPTGFDGQRRTQGHGPQSGVRRFETFWRYGEPRRAQLVDEPFDFHTEEAGRARLEADAMDERLHLGLGDGGAASLRTVTHRIGHVGILLRFHHAAGPGSGGPDRHSPVHPRPSRRFAQGCKFVACGTGVHRLRGLETLLRRRTSIAHDAFMGTTGENTRAVLVARTGVTP